MTAPLLPDTEEAFLAALRDDDPESLYDTAPCGYLSTTPDGLITKANRTLLTMLGRQPGELVGRLRLTELLTAGGRIYYETHVAPMLRMQGTVREIAFDMVHSDGSRIPVLVNAVVDLDPSGRPRTVRAAVFDAQQRRAYERELQRQKERAEAAEAEALALAATLQQTLIPPSAPSVPALDVGAVFRAGASGLDVGGDFYDVFQVSGSEWAVIIGDVCGKGIDAVAIATLTRYTLRAMCMVHASPADALRRTNDVLLAHPGTRFCTAACLRLRRHEGRWVGLLSSAGHPLALLRSADSAVRSVGYAGTVLNVLPVPQLRDAEVDLQPADALVLFTDGLPEGRRDGEFYGDARIASVLQDAVGSAQELAATLLDDSLAFQGGVPRDDIAIVAVTVPPARDGIAG